MESSRNDVSVPRAKPAPARPVANSSVSISLILVTVTLTAIILTRNWQFISKQFVPSLKRDVYRALSTAVTPTPSALTKTTRTSVLGTIISYDSQGAVVMNPSQFVPQRLYASTNPLQVVPLLNTPDTILVSEVVGDTQQMSEYSMTKTSSTPVASYSVGTSTKSSFRSNISVSPSGRYIADIHGEGDLSVYDRETQSDTLLRLSDTCRDAQGTRCIGYSTPQWSPDGQWLLTYKNIYDATTLAVINPFSEDEPDADLQLDSQLAVWLPSSSAVIAAGRYENLYYVGHFADPTRTSLLAGYFPDKSIRVTSMQLSSSTILGFSYRSVDSTKTTSSVGIYDVKQQRFTLVYTGTSDEVLRVVGWNTKGDELYIESVLQDRASLVTYHVQTKRTTAISLRGTNAHYVSANQ